jgi:hypothetical protein
MRHTGSSALVQIVRTAAPRFGRPPVICCKMPEGGAAGSQPPFDAISFDLATLWAD